MPKSDTEPCPVAPPRHPTEGLNGTRIDAAHVAGDQSATTAKAEAPVTEKPPDDDVAEQLRTQATQLAAQLRARQRELDHRESQTHARIAQLERDTRAARLWLAEREADLSRRGEELATRGEQAKLSLRAEQGAVAAAAKKELQRQAELARRQAEDALQLERQKIAARQEASQQLIRQLLWGVERRRQAVEAHAARLQERAAQPSPQLLAREEVLRRSAQALQAKQRQIEQAECRLGVAQAETEQLHEQLREAQRKAQDEGRCQRERLAAEGRRELDKLEQKRQAVQRRSEQVDQSRATLQRLRAELGRMHRETLEIRLATEELWVQLSGAAPPAALTRSLGRIRSKLADNYRLANAELRERKKELESLRSQMTEQYEKLVRQKRQFDQWTTGRQEETQQQAARLVAREEQLLQKEAEFQDQTHRWQAERLDYQQEIRKLRSRLSPPEEVPLPV